MAKSFKNEKTPMTHATPAINSPRAWISVARRALVALLDRRNNDLEPWHVAAFHRAIKLCSVTGAILTEELRTDVTALESESAWRAFGSQLRDYSVDDETKNALQRDAIESAETLRMLIESPSDVVSSQLEAAESFLQELLFRMAA